MFSKIIFVLATMYVVNASVLTVNVFEGDPETQAISNPKDCNFQECEQLCRRLKYPRGACVNGRCKCDNFLNAKDETENTLSDLEDSVLQNDDPETEVKANLRRCKPKVCDLVCRWLNKTNGSCVDGRCKCANSIVPEETMTEPAESLLLSSCNSIACKDQCRRTGWNNGFCINGQCKCNYFRNTEGNTLSNLEDSISPRRCTYQACNELCRRLKFTGGACINGRCKCDNFFGTEDAVDEYSELATRRICNLRRCNQTCTRRGYEVARCVNGWCKCFNKIQRQDASLISDVTSNENEESNVILRSNEEEPIVPSSSACNILVCTQWCYHLKYDVGWCRRGRCQCYKN